MNEETLNVPSPAEPDLDEGLEAYRLDLPTFQGPLDLLLHLIKQHKVDIYDIPIVLITRQYNDYLDAMQHLDLEVAADFIYMAAVLIHIKSKMLLPQDPEGEITEDPRDELVARLLEYQRFRSVAESLAELDVVRMGVWSRPASLRPGSDPAEIDMSEVSLFDLIDAFRTAMHRYKLDHPQAIELDRLRHRVSDKMTEIVEQLAAKSPIRLLWFLEGRGRDELVAIFLGVLELVRLGAISLKQDQLFEEIVLGKTELQLDRAEFAVYDR